jgi:hypothetical protein
MRQFELKLSKQEMEEFDALSIEEQDKYLATANEIRKQLMLKTVVLSNILIESFDTLESFGLMRMSLKHSAQKTKRLLEDYINQIYDVKEEESESIDYIAKVSKEIDKLL